MLEVQVTDTLTINVDGELAQVPKGVNVIEAMRVVGKEKEINLNTKHAEFIDWKWIQPNLLPEVIVDFKKDLYLNLLKEINLVIS